MSAYSESYQNTSRGGFVIGLQIEVQIEELIRQYFPLELQQAIAMYKDRFCDLQEIRCRVNRPLFLCYPQQQEQIVIDSISMEQMQYIISRMTQGSIYAWEEELRRGFLTLPGGFRVGLVGKGVLEGGHIRTLKQLNGLNFRIARERIGSADGLMPFLYQQQNIRNCLLVSPPGGGKTTILRDMIRQLSNGVVNLAQAGRTVAIVDERSELAGCVNGIAQMDVGCRTDILDTCPKSEGIRMLLRSMAPQVIAVDEIGTEADVQALEEAAQSGVAVIATAHGDCMVSLCHHPVLGKLVQGGYFSFIVFLHWENDAIWADVYGATGGASYEVVGHCTIDRSGQCHRIL